jgi:hypothetical protein
MSVGEAEFPTIVEKLFLNPGLYVLFIAFRIEQRIGLCGLLLDSRFLGYLLPLPSRSFSLKG